MPTPWEKQISTGRRKGRDTSPIAKVKDKVLAETHREKIKEAKLEIRETQWPMCKVEALVDLLAKTV